MRNPVDDLDGLTKAEFSEYLSSLCGCDKYNTIRDLALAIRVTDVSDKDDMLLIRARMAQLSEALRAYSEHVDAIEDEEDYS